MKLMNNLSIGHFGTFAKTVLFISIGASLALSLALAPSFVKAAEIVVPSGDSVQDAIDTATPGDTIVLEANGSYSSFTVNQSLTIVGAGVIASENPVVSGSVTVTSDDVSVSGLTVENPTGSFGILINGRSNVSVTGNLVQNIGTDSGITAGSAQGIYLNGGAGAAVTNVEISGNTITNIGHPDLGGPASGTSAKGIYVGDTAGTGTVEVEISNNTISDVKAATADWPTGRGAYGVLVNFGGSTTATITNNSFDDLEGLWVHVIGLEKNTPNTIIANNTIGNFTDHKTPTDGFAVFFQSNSGMTTTSLDGVILGDTSEIAVNAEWAGYAHNPVVSLGGNDYIFGVNAFATVQGAITAASHGSIIDVAAGTYTENINVNGKDGLTIRGAQAGVSAGVGASRNASSTVGETIINGTITTGSGTSGWPDGLTLDGLRLENTSFVNAIRVKGDVVITNSIVHFTSQYFLISVGGNVGTEHNLTLTNSNLTGERGFTAGNSRINEMFVDNNVFTTTAASLLSASALDGIATITNNEFNTPRGINILTNGNTITGNTFNITAGGSSRAIDLYEVTGNTITNNSFSSAAISINVVAGGRGEAVLNNTIEGNALLGGVVNTVAKTVDARGNWWGSVDGPEVGVDVIGDVLFDPFMSAPGTLTLSPNSIMAGNSATLSWSALPGVSSVTINGVSKALSGSETVSPGIGTHDYTADFDGTEVTLTLTVSGGAGGGGGGGAVTPPATTPPATIPPTTETTTPPTTTDTTTPPTTPEQGEVLGAVTYNFTVSFGQGSSGEMVVELQNLLTRLGSYTGPVTGYFGPLTFAGVKKFQAENGIPDTGFVGPLTLAALNASGSGTTGPGTTLSSAQVIAILTMLSDILSQIQAIQVQINALRAQGL